MWAGWSGWWRRACVVALAIVSGCTTEWAGWTDVPTATVTPVGPPEWTSVVSRGVAMWNDALTARGCPAPFTVGPDGHRIELLAIDRWRHDTAAGYTDTQTIEVRARDDGSMRDDGTVVHELGHALGLDHASAAFGPSVMIGKGHETRVVLERDAAAAACELGCGVCDPDSDPYSLL